MGRITSIKLKNGNSTIHDTAITYVPGANGSQTALVSTYKNGSDSAYSYEYDANGNITSITKGSQSFTYEYDSANQLIRENLYYGSGNSKSPPLHIHSEGLYNTDPYCKPLGLIPLPHNRWERE